MTDKLLDDLKRALGDAYTIERELTGGGMSRVFVAREHALGREVVIKVLPPELAAGVNRERFRREVQLAAQLSHPYIVPLLHAGEHGELLWFTMPYIAGESLRTRLQRSGPIKIGEVVKLLHDVVEALAYAHSRGVIHRDIKPGNILSHGQHALVTDFGVAKALSAALPMGGPGHTTSGMAIGTPAYMAPEQLAADPAADQRVDIYAVGLLAYEMLSGASPFAAPSPTATMTAQLTRIPEPLHNARPEIPTAFSALIQRCLSKEPENRPKDALTVLADLDRISGEIAADTHRGTTASRASAFPLILATAGVVALVGTGVWYTQRSPAPPKAAPPETTYLTRNPDSANLSTLPVSPPKKLTHADSLRIAEAMRDELARLSPQTKTPATVKADSAMLAVSLERQVAMIDSTINARLAEINRRMPSRGGVSVRTFEGPPARGGNGAAPGMTSVTPAIPMTPRAQQKLVLTTNPQRGRDNDPALVALSDSAARELARLLGRGNNWELRVVDPTKPQTAASRDSLYAGADVSVTVGLRPTSKDSASLWITFRHVTPQANPYEFRIISSEPVYRPASLDRFRRTLFDAERWLNDLRRLGPGVPWPRDSAGRILIGGPNDAPRMEMQMYQGQGNNNFQFLKLDSLGRPIRSKRGGQ